MAASQLLNDTMNVEYRQLSETPVIKEKMSVQSYLGMRTHMKLSHLKRTAQSCPASLKLPDLTVVNFEEIKVFFVFFKIYF